jgi:septum formation protein
MVLPAFVHLASQSPRRSQLLQQLGVEPRLFVPQAPADLAALEALEAVLPSEAAETYVQRVTRLKLRAAMDRWHAAQRALPPSIAPPAVAPILCADTTVVLGRRILGKPGNATEALTMLEALSGRTHRVLTAVAVGCPKSGQVRSALSVSRVRFTAMPRQALERYVASGEPLGKAGAYGIQGTAAQWVQHIEGSYSGIMGLPLFETAQLLAAFADCRDKEPLTCKTS